MSFEHEFKNTNKGGISRSGNVTGFSATDRHPSDTRLGLFDWLLILAIFAALVCVVLGITAWADVPFGGVQ